MILISLLIIPLIGIIVISSLSTEKMRNLSQLFTRKQIQQQDETDNRNISLIKITGLITTLLNLLVSIIIFILFNFSMNSYQFVQECHTINSIDFYLGIDGISLYFIILTTIIMPISILSN